MFTFPNCHQRYWMILHSEYKCDDLSPRMPVYLYKAPNGQPQEQRVFQTEEGQAFWNQMYRLDDSHKLKKSFTSTHYFKVPPGSGGVFRMFYDTHHSGVQATVTILDSKKKLIYSTDQGESDPEEHSKESGVIFLKLEDPQAQEPYQIQIDYLFREEKDATKRLVVQKCPLIEVLVII